MNVPTESMSAIEQGKKNINIKENKDREFSDVEGSMLVKFPLSNHLLATNGELGTV